MNVRRSLFFCTLILLPVLFAGCNLPSKNSEKFDVNLPTATMESLENLMKTAEAGGYLDMIPTEPAESSDELFIHKPEQEPDQQTAGENVPASAAAAPASEIAIMNPKGKIINNESVTIKKKQNQYTAAVFPENASQAVQWESSDNSIAAVSEDGKVEFSTPGTVTITVSAKDGSGVSASFTVTGKF